ncbi:MAG: hypothetical protein JWL81_24 [Verrucomicrobiales bacterium]|nr:hypothetical protein [Verrucomicrobiales bacterium]
MRYLKLSPHIFKNRVRRRGFGLLEMLLILGAISTVGALGYVGLGTATTSVKDVKLSQDVAALNRAVKTYAMSGGDLSTATSGETILAKLKTTMASSQQSTMAGLRGSMVDKRLQGVAASGTGSSRAVWDNSIKSFVIAKTGTGFREFKMDAVVQNVEETRKVVMALNTADKWIWSYNDQTAGTPAPRQHVISQPPGVAAPAAYEGITVLKSPDFSKPGALYSISAFKPDLKVGLVDRNTANTAETYYSIAGGAWQRWNGAPLSIPPSLLTQVRAYSAPLDPDRYEQSAIATADYETIFFSGSSSGLFTNPVGDPGLVTNLLGGLTGTLFTWGGPALLLGFDKPNSLSFSGTTFSEISPDEAFELGTLTYYNGTTYVGTNALGVLLNVKLNFSVPSVIETLPFTFQLLSSTNTKEDKKKDKKNKENEKQMDDADADYVYIPEVSTEFTTKIKGQTFYLVLRFGKENSNGFTTIDEFHTHESKSMTGTIYGIFTNHPDSVDWDAKVNDDDDDG